MDNIGLAILLFWVTIVSFTESDPAQTLSPEDEELINDEGKLAAELTRLRQIGKDLAEVEVKYAEILSRQVGTNFACAMDQLKTGFRYFLKFNGVKLLKCSPHEKWNPRMLRIRSENDLVWEDPHLMYPKRNKKSRDRIHRRDNITMCQWLSFVRRDLDWNDFNAFNPDTFILMHFFGDKKFVDRLMDDNFKRSEAISLFRNISSSLRCNLDEYYESLDQTTRSTRYPKGKEDLYSYFAGVMVRSYRLASYYWRDLWNTMQKNFRHTYQNGTKFFLSTALNESMSTWYFDQEQIEVLNVFWRTQGFTDDLDLFFVGKNITNGKGQKVVIPGFENCGMEPP
ncbi:uncharacterized protein LOC135847407 [Planococcus citri]|uniref:uncharacterized protein LOC135847407 n=1 Tax=Planococcus citri TaxID=170843 RepID=UPI0031F8CC7F